MNGQPGDDNSRWFSETLYPDFQQRFEITRVLYESRTGLQTIQIFENPRFGRVLALDGIVQTTEQDEFCYHEMLTHVPILAHGAAENVLIIGGGDGGALREVLRHRSVARATMVEIDDSVIDICRTYLPGLSDGAFDDPRAEVVIADGVRFVRESDREFDVVIIDSTDPIGPSLPLFTTDFYRACRGIMSANAILVCQSGVSFAQEDEARETYGRLKDVFEDPSLYITHVPTYGFGYMTLGWGARDPRPRASDMEMIRRRFTASGIETRYYNPGVHTGCFLMPTYMEALKGPDAAYPVS